MRFKARGEKFERAGRLNGGFYRLPLAYTSSRALLLFWRCAVVRVLFEYLRFFWEATRVAAGAYGQACDWRVRSELCELIKLR